MIRYFISKYVALWILCLFTCLTFTKCSTTREDVMPFYNFGYTGNRLLPIALNDADFTFRVWVNHGTSLERIISVSQSKEFGNEAYLDEISVSSKRNSTKRYYRKQKVLPLSGVEGFVRKVKLLNLFEFTDQKEDEFQVGLHQPFSLYVVEIKDKDRYHCFKFKTNYPFEVEQGKYYGLQQLLFNEIRYKTYIK